MNGCRFYGMDNNKENGDLFYCFFLYKILRYKVIMFFLVCKVFIDIFVFLLVLFKLVYVKLFKVFLSLLNLYYVVYYYLKLV